VVGQKILLRRHEQHVHLHHTVHVAAAENHVVEVHLFQGEGNVIFSLPADGPLQLVLGHIGQLDIAHDDAFAANRRNRKFRGNTTVSQSLADRFHARFALVSYSLFVGTGEDLGHAEFFQFD